MTPFQSLVALLSDIRASGPFPDARTMHDDVECRARRIHGWRACREYPSGTIEDGRGGRIDLLLEKPGFRVAMELDNKTPRVRSLAKIRSLDVDARVIALRSPVEDRVVGNVLVIGTGRRTA